MNATVPAADVRELAAAIRTALDPPKAALSVERARLLEERAGYICGALAGLATDADPALWVRIAAEVIRETVTDIPVRYEVQTMLSAPVPLSSLRGPERYDERPASMLQPVDTETLGVDDDPGAGMWTGNFEAIEDARNGGRAPYADRAASAAEVAEGVEPVSEEVAEQVRLALAAVERGEVVDLGDFTQYAVEGPWCGRMYSDTTRIAPPTHRLAAIEVPADGVA